MGEYGHGCIFNLITTKGGEGGVSFGKFGSAKPAKTTTKVKENIAMDINLFVYIFTDSHSMVITLVSRTPFGK